MYGPLPWPLAAKRQGCSELNSIAGASAALYKRTDARARLVLLQTKDGSTVSMASAEPGDILSVPQFQRLSRCRWCHSVGKILILFLSCKAWFIRASGVMPTDLQSSCARVLTSESECSTLMQLILVRHACMLLACFMSFLLSSAACTTCLMRRQVCTDSHPLLINGFLMPVPEAGCCRWPLAAAQQCCTSMACLRVCTELDCTGAACMPADGTLPPSQDIQKELDDMTVT